MVEGIRLARSSKPEFSGKDAPYTQSKIEPMKLREAERKVFAHDLKVSRKNSIDPPSPKHRNRARKGKPEHSS